jgi:hypothetical protein
MGTTEGLNAEWEAIQQKCEYTMKMAENQQNGQTKVQHLHVCYDTRRGWFGYVWNLWFENGNIVADETADLSFANWDGDKDPRNYLRRFQPRLSRWTLTSC